MLRPNLAPEADRLRRRPPPLEGPVGERPAERHRRVVEVRDLDGSGPIFGEGFVGSFDRFPGVERNTERLSSEFRLDLTTECRLPLGPEELTLRSEIFNIFNSTLISGCAEGIPGGGPGIQTGRPGDPMEFSTADPARRFQLSASYVF